MLTIEGTIVKGLGIATRTVGLQMKDFERQFPYLKGWHPATINVMLDAQLEVAGLDCVTTPIKWHPDPDVAPEVFGFKKVHFEYNAAVHEACIYIPFNSPHRTNPFYAEVILPSKITIGSALRCKIHFKEHTAKVIA